MHSLAGRGSIHPKNAGRAITRTSPWEHRHRATVAGTQFAQLEYYGGIAVSDGYIYVTTWDARATDYADLPDFNPLNPRNPRRFYSKGE